MRKVVSPGGATKPAATFKVGDKVVFYPTGVMTITAIGKRSELTPPGTENFSMQPARAFVGESILQPVTDDAIVYALRFLGEERDFLMLPVKATTRPPLRHVSTKDELSTFLAILGETLQDARVNKPPADLLNEILNAGNDLVKLARLYPYLPADDNKKRILESFFVQEIATVKGIDERDARYLFDHL
jgi:RNA polymerase-interacting CarD/CdnL/TRCF family regulator